MGGKFAELRQPRGARHAGSDVALSRRHAGDVLAVQRHGGAGRGPRLRDRVPRHQGDAVPQLERLRGRAGEYHAKRVRGARRRRTARRRRAGGPAPSRRSRRRRCPGRSSTPTTRATSSTASRAGKSPRATSSSATARPRRRSSPTSRTGRRSYLEWDAKAERFTNNEAANKLLSYEYRKPYKLPV